MSEQDRSRRLEGLAARVFADNRLTPGRLGRLPDDLCLMAEAGDHRLEVFAEHDGGDYLSVTARRDGDRTSELRFVIDVDTWEPVDTGSSRLDEPGRAR